MKKLCFILSISLLLGHSIWAQDREEILQYHSDIKVQTDGSILVQETIRVKSLAQSIRRGIFRSFPVNYRDRFNNRVAVDFDVLDVQRDGATENYQIKRQGDYKVLLIGDENFFLDPGIYEYQITYRTNRQIGFFEDFDELYWNAIGDLWEFPILEASATVRLPEGAEMGQYAAYSGPEGNNSCNCDIRVEENNRLEVAVRDGLNPKEALTVAVSWQKGVVVPPGSIEKAQDFLKDNKVILIGLIGLILAFIYFYLVWKRVGVDPQKGVIIPIFDSPRGLSPAACSYILKMKFDDAAFVSCIVELAIKKVIKIEELKKRKYRLLLLQSYPLDLTEVEKEMVAALFPNGARELALEQKEHKKINASLTWLKEDLKKKYHRKYFLLNIAWLVPGMVISGITIILMMKTVDLTASDEEKMFLVFSIFFLAIIFFSVKGTLNSLEQFAHLGFLQKAKVIFGLLITLFILLAPVFVIHFFDLTINYGWLLIFLLFGIMNALFAYWIKAPTEQGRKVMDEIEGFRMYLNTAEREIIQRFNPPALTPEIFEQYLPYAIALNVGDAWGKSFENELAKSSLNERRGGNYSPGWYTGAASFKAGSVSAFSKNLNNSFGSALSNSASAPGSKSGSGGGGRSGGGGGGGGGGGW